MNKKIGIYKAHSPDKAVVLIDYDGEESGYYRQVEQFIKAVEAGDQKSIRTNYADAAKSLAVTIAANKSLESGKIEKVEL